MGALPRRCRRLSAVSVEGEVPLMCVLHQIGITASLVFGASRCVLHRARWWMPIAVSSVLGASLVCGASASSASGRFHRFLPLQPLLVPPLAIVASGASDLYHHFGTSCQFLPLSAPSGCLSLSQPRHGRPTDHDCGCGMSPTPQSCGGGEPLGFP